MINNKLYIYTCSGGGVREIALFGAQLAGKQVNKWHPDKFDYITGDSAGALDAALTANNWTPEQKIELFLNTDFTKLLTNIPWFIRKPMSLIKPLSLEGISKMIDSLNLQPSERLFINTWDMELGKQVIYCEKIPEGFQFNNNTIVVENAISKFGYGTLITRSMALPGLLADNYKYMDGGIAEHPPLSFLPKNAHVLLLTLGYAGLVRPFQKSLIERSYYAYEVKSKVFMDKCISDFSDIHIINPKIYDVNSTDFNITKIQKQNIINRSIENTKTQWENYQITI